VTQDYSDLSDKAILTPPELYAALDSEFHFDFDPCPYPKPADFNGLVAPWGERNYCNPPFWHIDGQAGITAWVRKALAERDLGKLTVMALPVDGWVKLLLDACAPSPDVRFLAEWYWMTPNGDRRKDPRKLALWVIRPKPARESEGEA
jgi:hypothetical protein